MKHDTNYLIGDFMRNRNSVAYLCTYFIIVRRNILMREEHINIQYEVSVYWFVVVIFLKSRVFIGSLRCKSWNKIFYYLSRQKRSKPPKSCRIKTNKKKWPLYIDLIIMLHMFIYNESFWLRFSKLDFIDVHRSFFYSIW